MACFFHGFNFRRMQNSLFCHFPLIVFPSCLCLCGMLFHGFYFFQQLSKWRMNVRNRDRRRTLTEKLDSLELELRVRLVQRECLQVQQEYNRLWRSQRRLLLLLRTFWKDTDWNSHWEQHFRGDLWKLARVCRVYYQISHLLVWWQLWFVLTGSMLSGKLHLFFLWGGHGWLWSLNHHRVQDL